MFKPGFTRLLAAIVISLVMFSMLAAAKRGAYMAFQHLSFQLGFNFNNIASQEYVDWIKSQNGEHRNIASGIFLGEKVKVYNSDWPSMQVPSVLGTNTPDDDKWIEVDLSEQKLYMKERDKTILSFLVSTGRWMPTPTGEWRIWSKFRYTRMKGGSQALGTFYDLPNVPYTMFYNNGYGIHGAYWHNNFGNPMSHGCVNMKPEEAGIVFNWAQVGTRVVVHS